MATFIKTKYKEKLNLIQGNYNFTRQLFGHKKHFSACLNNGVKAFVTVEVDMQRQGKTHLWHHKD